MRTRIVVLGYGAVGREHVRLTCNSTGAEIVGISDIDPRSLRSAPQEVDRFVDYKELLDQTRPDGAIVALPNALHFEAGMAAIERNIPILMEKPITSNIWQARQLVDAAASAKVPILVGHHRRHAPDIQCAKETVESGRIGHLLAVNGMWLAKKSDCYFDVPWRRTLGGGPIYINLIHDLDMLRFICGHIARVQAFAGNHGRHFEVEDTVALSMRFANGAVGTFVLSDAVPSPYTWDGASRQALNLPHHPSDCYFFGGSKGCMTVPSLSIAYHLNEGSWTDPLLREHHRYELASCYERQLQNFLNVINGSEIPLCSGEDGLQSLLAVQAVLVAALTGSNVEVCERSLAQTEQANPLPAGVGDRPYANRP